jgi:L-lactate dehydrogenase complex protein LldF
VTAPESGGHGAIPFRPAAAAALKDAELRANFRRAMDGLMEKRGAALSDPEEWRLLRALGASIRARSLAKLPELLLRLEASCSKNGIQVHWAETSDEANAIVYGILERRGATHVVKGKSMVSEEMRLNDYLEARGIESLESDLGEYIIQLDHEMPSHIIAPAIHKNRKQIARLFGQRIREAVYTEEIDAMTALARKVLRRKFFEADAGISGVNFAVAETGTLCLVENEGNGRMCTHVPPVHIALMTLEKVVERLEDVPPLYSLLTRSATGQAISTYFNMISGPRRTGEKDGPEEVHLVVLDAGRTRILLDAELSATLRCIRCGACMNHCPVYTRTGGHAYRAVYPGPIGKVLTPQLEGLDRRPDLLEASSLCGACGEVCPVGIPIPELIGRLRREAVAGSRLSRVAGAGSHRRALESVAWKLWAVSQRSPAFYGLLGRAATRLRFLLPRRLPLLSAWTSVRAKPRPAGRTLHELARRERLPEA